MATITGIGQIHISVTDLEDAVAFYRDTLELELLYEFPDQQMAFFDCGGIRLYLGVAEDPGLASHPLIYLTTPDIAAAHARLLGRGVEFLQEPTIVHRDDDMELWTAFFLDNAGRHMALMEERAPTKGTETQPTEPTSSEPGR